MNVRAIVSASVNSPRNRESLRTRIPASVTRFYQGDHQPWCEKTLPALRCIENVLTAGGGTTKSGSPSEKEDGFALLPLIRNDQKRTRRMAHQSRRHASEKQPLHQPSATGAGDDEIGFRSIREAEKRR